MSTRPKNLPTHLQHYIGGKHCDSIGGETFAVSDPVTNTEYATVAAGQKADVDAAAAAALAAFEDGPWPRMTNRERSKILMKIADAVAAADDRIAELESFDSGLPITQARGQAQRAAENFRFFADLIVGMNEDAYRVADTQINYVVRKPVGVAGLITPWNTPFMLESWKLAPSMASGCPVILKPAEWTPLSASLWPEIMESAGVPEGVFNLVHGIGEEAGDALVKHPQVPRISFTGESATGSLIMSNSAVDLKGLSMELGGKSPNVIFADTDVDDAVDGSLFQLFSLNGERCTAGTRILVQREIYNEFVEKLGARARKVKVGEPSDPNTELGALVHPEHYDRVMEYVQSGKDQGARCIAGGKRPDALPVGNFLEATVFADVTPEMKIFQEEIFGPVGCVTPFDTVEDAINLANDTKYGLAAYVWTNDLKRGHKVAAAIDSGMVWLNSHNVRDLRTPFGGVKASGIGHEGGTHSIDFYTDQQIVHVTLGDVHVPRFGLQE